METRRVILETDRFILRELQQSDYNDLCKILQDEDVMYAYQGAFTDEEVQQCREAILKYGLTFEGAYVDTPFRDDNWVLLRYRKNKKAFAWTYERNGKMCVNVKVDPEWRDFWRSAYEAVQPGYHQNKEHWNTIILDGTIPDKDIKQMIAESYDLIASTH